MAQGKFKSCVPTRRGFLASSASSVLLAIALPARVLAQSDTVTIENYSPSGDDLGAEDVPKVVKSEAEWRQSLSEVSFAVTRHAQTEQPFTGATWNNHADGLYRCICCDTAAFDSHTKFESGTGWPSFWRPISKRNIEQSRDLSTGDERIAIACKRCDAHLGHVFSDGPRPTGLRYCMNSAALRFVPSA